MRSIPVRRQALCLVLFVTGLVLASCGSGNEQASTSQAALTSPAITVSATTPGSAVAGSEATSTSAAAAGSTATVLAEAEASPAADLPTAAPTITAAPTATPFALQSGWWDNAVCYEVFVRSFYDSNGDGVGDLNGLIQKLDYINDGDPNVQNDLGANCIWLMPIAESPSYHGYDVVDYYSVDKEYGTNDDFKRLVAEAHKRGIKVILDLVLNHTSDKHPWFQEALNDPASPRRDWYLWSADDPGYKGPWGDVAWHQSPARDEFYYGIFWSGMPDLNYRNAQVTEEAHNISAFWLNELGADGFRLDAIKHLIENGRIQEHTRETHAWLRQYRAFLQQTKPDVFTIGEIFDATSATLAPYYPDQLDTYFQFDVGNKLIAAANFGSAGQFTSALTDANAKLPFQRWAPFLTNHDQPRVMNSFGGNVEEAKIAATGLLTLPGLPFMYYGEEIGMVGTKPDENIRTPMQWSGDRQGFTSGQPWRAFQSDFTRVNVAIQNDDPASLLNLYRRLIHLHTSEPALGHGSFTAAKASNAGVSAFLRQAGEDALLVVLNFGQRPAENVAISVEQSELAAGTYNARPLLGDARGAPLTVGEGGALTDYVPLPSLAPKTGYIFKLEQ